MGTKYQVFLSSTFRDLHQQRALLVDATLKAGHFPVGMEYFAAGGQPKWEYITKLIDSSDYYAVIIADWYGSTVKAEGGISYTEKEFDYAVGKGLKPLVFPLRDDAQWDRKHSEPDPTKRERLTAFKEKAKEYMAGLWRDDTDLVTNYLSALHVAIAQDPRTGWVRGSQAASPKVAEEIARLSQENERLRGQLALKDDFDPEERRLSKVIEELTAMPSCIARGCSIADAVRILEVTPAQVMTVQGYIKTARIKRIPSVVATEDAMKLKDECQALSDWGIIERWDVQSDKEGWYMSYWPTVEMADLKKKMGRDLIRMKLGANDKGASSIANLP